jgi:hypothetical protein
VARHCCLLARMLLSVVIRACKGKGWHMVLLLRGAVQDELCYRLFTASSQHDAALV